MDTDNFFFILGLPFSPVPDTATVEEAIAKKQSEWSRQLNNPRKKDNAKKWLADIGLMQMMLADPSARKMLAEQAQNIQQDKLSELEKLLSLNYTEETLSKKDISYLLNRYGFYQISERNIRNLYQKVLDSRKDEGNQKSYQEETWDHISLPDRFLMDNIDSQLKILGKEDLYDFLNLSSQAYSQRLLAALDSLEKTLRESAISDQNEAGKKLCGFARDVFASDEERRKYDNYLDIKAWNHLYKWIDINADTNDKNVVQVGFLNRLFQQLPSGTDYGKVAKAISLYCRFRKYQIADTGIRCPHCGAKNKQAFLCGKCDSPLFFIPGSQGRKPQRTASPQNTGIDENDYDYDHDYGDTYTHRDKRQFNQHQQNRRQPPQRQPAQQHPENPVPRPAPMPPSPQEQGDQPVENDKQSNPSIGLGSGCAVFFVILLLIICVIGLVSSCNRRSASSYRNPAPAASVPAASAPMASAPTASAAAAAASAAQAAGSAASYSPQEEYQAAKARGQQANKDYLSVWNKLSRNQQLSLKPSITDEVKQADNECKMEAKNASNDEIIQKTTYLNCVVPKEKALTERLRQYLR